MEIQEENRKNPPAPAAQVQAEPEPAKPEVLAEPKNDAPATDEQKPLEITKVESVPIEGHPTEVTSNQIQPEVAKEDPTRITLKVYPLQENQEELIQNPST